MVATKRNPEFGSHYASINETFYVTRLCTFKQRLRDFNRESK